MTSLQERVNRLQAATANGPALEQAMLREPIISVALNGTGNPGASRTYVVVYESRRQAILKPFGGQNPNACAYYKQNGLECLTHEVVAWRLAHSLGEPFDQLLPTAVMRDVPGAGPGVLVNFRDGSPNHAVFYDAPAQVHAVAFWDALIGQQDRHAGNFRYDANSRRLAAIDSAFAFARPGDILHGALFVEHRLGEHGNALAPDEVEALERLRDEDYFGLLTFLAPDRAQAFAARTERMLNGGVLLGPGDF